jgi:bud site selection protein 20
VRLVAVWFGERILIFNRVKALKEGPYTQKEAEAAVGLRTDNGPRMMAKENVRDMEVEMENSGLLEESAT